VEEKRAYIHTMAIDLEKQQSERNDAVAPKIAPAFEAFSARAFEQKGTFASLYESLHELISPKKLPPLELSSTPIPVPDRMKVKANPWAVGISTTFNLAILCIVLFWAGKKVIDQIKKPDVTMVDVTQFKGPKLPKTAGGGGGGDHNPIETNQGKLPKLEKNPIVPPKALVEKPKIAEQPAINVQQNLEIPDNPSMPVIGMKNSSNVKLASSGTGSGGGLGSGSGNGLGAGSGGNTGGSLYRIGGAVSAPSPLYQPEAEFSDEARRAKYQGVCLVSLIVDAQGNPQDPHVVRSLGMGLDEKAIEAVRKYKFRPAMKDGKTPVPVKIYVEVNFRLY
jgi:protein TonB